MSAKSIKINRTTYTVIERVIMENGTAHLSIQKGRGQVKSLFFNDRTDLWTLWSKQNGRSGVGMPKLVRPVLIEDDGTENFSAFSA